MTKKSPDEKIAELEQQKRQLDAQIQKHKARARVEERKRDTRRKIIAGALALEHASIDPAFRAELHRLIRQNVIRDGDRDLFDLSPQ